MNPAAFQATYADFKLIKTRGVVSISFELPVEQAQAALDVLGGMPLAATEVWCGIARLNPGAEATPTLAPSTKVDASPTSEAHGPNSGFDSRDRGQTSPRQEPSAPDGEKTKTAFRDMRLANQAGMLCDQVPFQKFMSEEYANWFEDESNDVAQAVRRYCGVKSRSDIRPRTPSGDRWTKLHGEYKMWMHEVV